MPQKSSTFLDELANAARGCFALLRGNRQSAMYFDFSHRGLAGSLIALLIASALGAFLPQLFGMASKPVDATVSLILGGVLYLIQLGAAWLALRQMGRLDGFVPFMVADNWATFFTSLLAVILLVVAGPNDIIFLAIGIVVIILEINIARLAVTLAPLQVATFIIAQLVASFIGMALIGSLVPATV